MFVQKYEKKKNCDSCLTKWSGCVKLSTKQREKNRREQNMK